MLQQLYVYMQKEDSDPYLTSYTKINSKCITDLSVRAEMIKHFEESKEENLHDLGLGRCFSIWQ